MDGVIITVHVCYLQEEFPYVDGCITTVNECYL